jgi:8-oxo-dGTP pyrophosphatase MutT (NUDIX family)
MKTRKYSSAGGVIIENDRMLLLDRPSREEVRLPKGHIEPGESPMETALREVQEEAGIANLEIVADLGVQEVEYDYKRAHYKRTEYYYLMRKVDAATVDRPPKDAKDFQPFWKPLDEAVELLTYEAEKQVAEQAISAYRKAASTDDSG